MSPGFLLFVLFICNIGNNDTGGVFQDETGKERAVAIINVYCPRVDPEKPERLRFKLRFYELLRQRAAAVWGMDSHVIIVGDINTSHKRIDHCDPDKSEVSIFYFTLKPDLRCWLQVAKCQPM